MTVRATDSGGLTFDKVFDIAVTDIDDTIWHAPPVKNVFNPAHPAGWSPAPIGDFNGDGTSDIAWFNASTGNVDIWKLQDGTWAGSSDVGSHPAGYQPVGSGDFDSDGTSDLIWFNPTTRDLDLWKISDGHWAGSVDIGTHPAGLSCRAARRLQWRRHQRLAWYNASTGDMEIWKIANGQWAGSVNVGSHPAGYQPCSPATSTATGRANCLVQSDNGRCRYLEDRRTGSGPAAAASARIRPAGSRSGPADYNSDGTADIAWYNPTNNNVDVWLIEDGQWSASVDIGSIRPAR